MAKKKKAPEGGGAGWIVTWSDMMSLMFCFFVLLFASSGSGSSGSGGSAAEFMQTMSASVRGSFKISQLNNMTGIAMSSLMGSGIVYMPSLSEDEASTKKQMDEQERQIQHMAENFKTYFAEISEEGGAGVEIKTGGTYIEFIFEDSMLFDKGKAELKPSAINTLDMIAAQLNQFPGSIINIEGHTDSDPISTSKYKDNWALSCDRATEVGRYLINQRGIAPNRVIAIGYGEYAPLVENTTEENKTKNRRVEIKITNNAFGNE